MPEGRKSPGGGAIIVKEQKNSLLYSCLGFAFFLLCLQCCSALIIGALIGWGATATSMKSGSSSSTVVVTNNTVLQKEVNYILESLSFCNISNTTCPAEVNITGLEIQVQNNTDILNHCNLTLDFCGGTQGPPGQNGTCTDQQCNSSSLSEEIQQIENILNTCGITNSSCPGNCWECELSGICPARNIEFFSPNSAGGLNQDIAFTNMGTGAFTITEYGNYGACRGNYSVDFQRFRFGPNEVTLAPFSVILNGRGNKNAGYQSTISNGDGIYISAGRSFVGNGLNSFITEGSDDSAILTGIEHAIEYSPVSTIIGGDFNTIRNSSFTMEFGRGLQSIAQNTKAVVIIGDYNDPLITHPGEQVMFSIGSGSSPFFRQNAFTVTDIGSVRVAPTGSFTIGGAYFNSFWIEHEQTTKLKWGSTVKLLRNGKFRDCQPNEVPDFVVVPPNPGMIHNSAEDHWHLKFILNESTSLFELNPKFDPKKIYVPRSQRPQWHVVTRSGFVKIFDQSPKDYQRWIPLKGKTSDEDHKSWWYLN